MRVFVGVCGGDSYSVPRMAVWVRIERVCGLGRERVFMCNWCVCV